MCQSIDSDILFAVVLVSGRYHLDSVFFYYLNLRIKIIKSMIVLQICKTIMILLTHYPHLLEIMDY